MRKTFTIAVAAATLTAGLSVAPGHAATTPAASILGTVSFSATGTGLSTSGTSKLKGWAVVLKQATAVTVEGYGGTKSVASAKASARALARAKAVKAWLTANKAGGSITVVNKGRASSAGSDQGNRVVVIVTKRNVTVTVQGAFDAPLASQSPVCDFTVSSVKATQGTTQVAVATTSAAAGVCSRKFTLKSVPTGRGTTLTVAFGCNESGDGTPAEDVCAYAAATAPWNAVVLDAGDFPITGTTQLTSVTVGATTGSVASAVLTATMN